MNPKLKPFLLWVVAFLVTAGAVIYQRTTGPTYPVRGKISIDNQVIKYKLIRTWEGTTDARITIIVPDTSIHGDLTFRRFKSYDNWTTSPMKRSGDTLFAFLPGQEAAGKVMYEVKLRKDNRTFSLTEHPAILRYKSYVPLWILIPHIIIIFLGMLFSTRVAFEVIFRGKYAYLYTWITVIMLFVAAMILGPLVQKFAFNAYWTGWPFGKDLTDNKSLVMLIFWIIALMVLRKKRDNKLWPILAAVVLWVVFLIPHSLMGSEIDYTKEVPPAGVDK